MSSLKISESGRVVSVPDASALAPSQDGFWRSLSDLDDTPQFKEFLQREYPAQEDQISDPLSRRRFVQLMGASFAFAGVAQACRWEEEKIIPLSRRPEGYVPGVAKRYASAYELGGVAAGLLVTCMDGRPIKIEGNPTHPYTGSASTALAQASILELYDPDRSRSVRHSENNQPVAAVRNDAIAALKTLGTGKGLRILSEATSSPSVKALRDEILANVPGATWHEYEPLSQSESVAGNKMALGAAYRTRYRLDRASRIVTFDAELFGNSPAGLRYSKDFAATRDPDKGALSRLYAIESNFSLTGAIADHRLPVRSELIKPILLGLEAALSRADIGVIGAAVLSEGKIQHFITSLAADLMQNRGKSVVAVGSTQPAEVHAIAARINATLGNHNSTVIYTADEDRARHVDDLKSLTDAMHKNTVGNLLILGGNPVYNAPADLDFAGALGKVKNSMHLSSYEDETSKLCNWHIPRAHYLECWGDTASYDGTVSVVQPMIEPLYEGFSTVDVLKSVVGKQDTSSEALIRTTLLGAADASPDSTSPNSDKGWRRILHDGFVTGTATSAANVQVKAFNIAPLTESQKLGSRLPNGKLEVTFRESSATYDGRYANNGWLVETPDFVTKMTWDNAALISPATAKEFGVANGDMLGITVGERSITIAAHVTPGQAAYSLGLPLGWGRKRAGYVGGHEDHKVKPIGFDTYGLRTAAGFHMASGATIKRTGENYPLAETQDHFALDDLGTSEIKKRVNVQIKTGTVKEYSDLGQKLITNDAHLEIEKLLLRPIKGREINASLYDEVDYSKGHKWGMSIDLGKCTGCNSCMLACQSENNVPIVGKEEVMNNREMHWIRIDRYFKGNPESPEMALQPVHCQQCEGAPCEVVCPVEATVHTAEGLNDMAYNRCVGTRYCANNCPYKVRKFNYKYWNKDFDLARNKVRKLLSNPDVTVRSRGVMEKCTWCVQRIERTRIESKNKRQPIVDGSIQTACEQACPTGAIRFGDLNDKTSRVYKNQELPRAYALLAGLNNSPRNAFLARITNPNPALAPVKETKHHE